MDKQGNDIVILGSLIGYGAVIPAILLYQQWKEEGKKVIIHAIEHYYRPEKRGMLEATKTAFQRDVRVSKIASKMRGQFENNIGKEQKEALFQDWHCGNCTRFVSFSGLWSDLLQEYRQRYPFNDLRIISCKVDSGFSAAWKEDSSAATGTVMTSFFNAGEAKVNFKLPPPHLRPMPYSDRRNTLVIHGGGWDIGRFDDVCASLPAEYVKQVVTLGSESPFQKEGDGRVIRPVFKWDPLNNPDHLYRLPVYAVDSDPGNAHAGLYGFINRSRAILSKPGGMTLMDSLVTATPLIMLDPIGSNEEENLLFWEKMGYGMRYRDWAAAGYTMKPLYSMHEKLLKECSSNRHFACFVNDIC